MKLILIAILLISVAFTLDNGVALTPPMGWMTWLRWMCEVDCGKHPDDCINEKLVIEHIDAIASKGFLDAGYNYVNIDDCWESFERDSNNRLQPNATRFPHGMKWLSDYANSKGVKLGSYTDYGTKTCGGYPGSKEYLEIDAQTFADWHIENLKVDGCYAEVHEYKDGYTKFGQELNKTGLPIVYACSWPAYDKNASFPYLETICNLWRPWYDIGSSWYSVSHIITWWGDNNAKYAASTGPGHWVDPDMLVIGNEDPSLGIHERKSQMAMWSIFAAPLYMSTDLRNMTQENLDILLNKEVIAIDQDKLGKSGLLKDRNLLYELWTKELENGEYACAIYNFSDKPVSVYVDPVRFGLSVKNSAHFKEVNYGKIDFTINAGEVHEVDDIPSHATMLFRVKLA